MKRISVETKNRVRELLHCGMTGYEIKERTGVSISSIVKIRKAEEQKGFDIWHVGGLRTRNK